MTAGLEFLVPYLDPWRGSTVAGPLPAVGGGKIKEVYLQRWPADKKVRWCWVLVFVIFLFLVVLGEQGCVARCATHRARLVRWWWLLSSSSSGNCIFPVGHSGSTPVIVSVGRFARNSCRCVVLIGTLEPQPRTSKRKGVPCCGSVAGGACMYGMQCIPTQPRSLSVVCCAQNIDAGCGMSSSGMSELALFQELHSYSTVPSGHSTLLVPLAVVLGQGRRRFFCYTFHGGNDCTKARRGWSRSAVAVVLMPTAFLEISEHFTDTDTHRQVEVAVLSRSPALYKT